MAYRTTRRDDQDIIDIYLRGCAEFGRLKAESYRQGLAATLELIGDVPHIAHERAELDPPVRLHPYRSHLIVYLVAELGVPIVRVLHGRQAWERHL